MPFSKKNQTPALKITELANCDLAVTKYKRYDTKYGPSAICHTECGRKFYANRAVMTFLENMEDDRGEQFCINIGPLEIFQNKDKKQITWCDVSCYYQIEV